MAKANLNLITRTEVIKLLSISPSTLNSWIRNNPKFPKPIYLGARSIRFRVDEINAFIDSMGVC